jgi:serine/threonine-protein kinase RsbW
VSDEPRSAESARNTALVKIAVGPLVGPVLSRVVGIVAARADCPVDRLDNALLVVDALAAHAGAQVPDGRVAVRVSTWDDALELLVGPLREGGAQGLIRDSVVPGVGNVLERVADAIDTRRDPDTGAELLAIRISFAGRG